MHAFCWASGQIEFGRSVPKGAIAIASGPAAAVRKLVIPTSRMAYDGKTLLVPGVPEAADQDEAADALMHHLNWIRRRKPQGVRVCSMRPRADQEVR